MKKILSLVLALMMVLSMTTVAFAGTFEDVEDANTAKAVEALTTLKIVSGYPDGSYKPGNAITRAELAKILVEALGYSTVAQGSESSFKDAQGKWYDGYVAMASGLEIVTGYPDGTFKGENTVSYQEAAVMILRTLGYTNTMVNGGIDAYNASKYKALAATLGIIKNITFANSGANRGDVAIMLFNALDVPVVVPNKDGKPEKVVLKVESTTDPMTGITTYSDIYKVLIDNIAVAKPITVSEDNVNPGNAAYIKSAVDLVPYLYQNITAYFNEDGKLLVVKKVNSDVIDGNVSTPRTQNLAWVAGKVFVTTDKGTTKLELANATIPMFVNNGHCDANISDFQYLGAFGGADVKFVLDNNGEIIGAIANEVMAVATFIEKTYKTGATVLGDIYLPKTNGKVDLSKVTVKGAVDSIEDIQLKDVVFSCPASLVAGVPTETVLLVARDTVQGKVTKTNAGENTIYIDNNPYYLAYGIDSAEVGSEGIFYLDPYGYVYEFEGKKISNNDYAMVTRVEKGIYIAPSLIKEAYINILDKDGKVKSYKFDTAARYTFDGTTFTDVFPNATAKAQQDLTAFRTLVYADPTDTTFTNGNLLVVGFEVNSNGEINKIQFENLSNTSVNYGSKTFTAADNLVVYSTYVSGGNTYYEVAEVTALPKVATAVKVAYNEDGEIAAIVIPQQLTSNTYAVVTNYEWIINSNNEKVRLYTAYVDGEKVQYTAKYNSTANGMTVALHSNNKLYKVVLTSDGLVSDLQEQTSLVPVITNSTTSSAIEVSIKANNFKVVASGDRYAFSENTVVYVYNRQAARNDRWSFAYVGDLGDLDLLNYDVYIYNTVTTNDTVPGTSNDVLEYVILVERATN